MQDSTDLTVSHARAEAERMRAAIANADDDAKVTMSTGQFATLSQLITHLCDRAADSPGEMGDPRYWVPLEIFAKVRKAASQLQAECDILRMQVQPSLSLKHGQFDVR